MPDVRYLHTTFRQATVIRTPAEIDITTAGQLRTVLVEAAAGQYPVVVVDMTRTAFCDSAGLHTLVRARNRITADGGDLRLVIPADGAVARIIALSGLGTVFPCFSSLAAAACAGSEGGRLDTAS